MKNFPPFFLASLLSFASFSNLNSQVQNRLEATNQLTDCRLQVTGLETIKLLSEDRSFQTDQRAKSTTNYQLSTTNSNNQGNSLGCYLMMNPAVEGAEEAMELALSETRVPSKVIKSISSGVPASEANSLSSFSVSSRITANVTASSHQNKASSSEDEEISSSSNNESLQAMLLAEIQSNIETLGTANVAGKLLEQEEQIKNKLEKDHPNITWDWNSVNLDELIHQALEKKYELAYLASLWTENEVADQALAECRGALKNLHEGNNKLSPKELAFQKAEAETLAKDLQKKSETERLLHQKQIRRYVWSDRKFDTWELPGEVPEISYSETGAALTIEPPQMLHEEAEDRGRKLFAEVLQASKVLEDNEGKSTSTQEESFKVVDIEAEAQMAIMEASLNPTEENKTANEERLNTRLLANQRLAEAAALAKESRRLREAKAEANEKGDASDERSSMFSAMSSTVFGALSKANTETGLAGKSVKPIDLKAARIEAEEAEGRWEVLVLDAEKKRTSKNQLPLMDDEAILRVWKKADQETLKLQKKEVAALSFKEDWKANNSRWKTYLMAEQLAQEVVTLEEDVARLQEKGLIIKDKNARGKGSDEEVKQACKKVAAAEAKLIAARTEAQKTQAEYDTLASNHQSVMRMNDSEERAVVLQKLKQSDQAVTDLWCALTKSYTKDEIPEPLSLESQQMQQQREVAIYELKRKRDLLHCFEEADQAALAAKQQYKKGDKKGAEALYEDVDQKEIVAWKAYTEAAKNDALESARKRISGMMTFWAERKSNAEAVRKAKELDLSFKKNQKAIGGWADENQRALARLTALAAAEEQAFILYQREEQRLTDIESLWIAIIEAKKEVLRTRAATAAAAFLAGNSMPWSQLSSEERSAYNGEINEINNVYEKSFADEITVAEEEVERVRHKVKKAWLYTDASDNQALESAQMALDNLHAKTRNRQEMRQLGGLTPEKRILKLNEMKQKQVVQKRKPLSPKIEPLQLKTEALQKELRAVRSLEIKKVKDAINDANNSLKYALAVTTKARLQEQGKNNVVELWIEACNNYHLSIEHSIQAANAYVAKKDVRGEEYEKKAKGARDDAWKCYGAAVATTKATGAQEARKESVAALWLQAAQQKRISNEAITAFTQELQKIWDVLYLQHNDLFLKASETENSEIKNRYLKAKIAQEYFSHVVGNYIKEPSEVTLIAIQNAAAIMAVSADRVYGCLPDSSAPGLSYWGLSGIYASIAELKVLDGYSLIQSIGDMIGHPVRYPNMLLTIARVDALSSLTQIANRINRINFSEFDKNENDSDGINYWKKTAELLVEMIKTLNDFAEATGQGFEEGRGSVPLTIIES